MISSTRFSSAMKFERAFMNLTWKPTVISGGELDHDFFAYVAREQSAVS